MAQATLFDQREKVRLSRQNQLILNRLLEGPTTNDELHNIALKYTSRISDLRKLGYDIKCYDQNKTTGLTWYRLV